MADGATVGRDVPQGRIKREDADAMVMACLVTIATGMFDDTDRDLALHLLARALPMASRSSRMELFRPIAESILRAAPPRRTRPGAHDWFQVNGDLRRALSRDAAQRAAALVEV